MAEGKRKKRQNRWFEGPHKYGFTVQYGKGNMDSDACASSRRSLSAEGDSCIVDALFLSDPTKHQWRNRLSVESDMALV